MSNEQLDFETAPVSAPMPVQAPQQPRIIPEVLSQQEALQVLVDAARMGQAKGIFSLDDAEIVNKAIKAFMPPTPQGPVASNS